MGQLSTIKTYDVTGDSYVFNAEKGHHSRDWKSSMKSQVSMRSYIWCMYVLLGFPGGSVVKKLPTNAGDARDTGLIPGSGRSPGEGNGNPLKYSCLGNPMDGRAW